VVNGTLVTPEPIRRTALFTVEGERDDICSIGQTVAAHDLCSEHQALPEERTMCRLGVGHYGVFSGKALAPADLPAGARE
jgi:poly(3-hydroxybutyrate) depolymerase